MRRAVAGPRPSPRIPGHPVDAGSGRPGPNARIQVTRLASVQRNCEKFETGKLKHAPPLNRIALVAYALACAQSSEAHCTQGFFLQLLSVAARCNVCSALV